MNLIFYILKYVNLVFFNQILLNLFDILFDILNII